MSCGVDRRCGSDPALPWLWCRLAATALIGPPSLGTSMCHGCSPRKDKKRKKKSKENIGKDVWSFLGLVFSSSNKKPSNGPEGSWRRCWRFKKNRKAVKQSSGRVVEWLVKGNGVDLLAAPGPPRLSGQSLNVSSIHKVECFFPSYVQLLVSDIE